jgi:hypothetical protein
MTIEFTGKVPTEPFQVLSLDDFVLLDHTPVSSIRHNSMSQGNVIDAEAYGDDWDQELVSYYKCMSVRKQSPKGMLRKATLASITLSSQAS